MRSTSAALGPLLLVALGRLAAQVPDSVAHRVDQVFSQLDNTRSPGCIVGVTSGGMSITRAYGMANLEYGAPLTVESISEAGSVSKQFVAAATVLLAQRGKLSLDDDIRTYLPEIHNFGTPITIRMLLHHISGLRDQWTLLALKGREPGTAVHSLEEVLDLISLQRDLNFPPGTRYLYSNTGYILLRVIVERVSGEPLGVFTHHNLFEPLGMTHTRWREDFAAVLPGRTTAYSTTPSGGFRLEMPFSNVFGSGGLLTTVGDLLKWNANLDHPVVGGQALVDTMTRRGVLRDGRDISYALGLLIGQYHGTLEVQHSGATAGYRAFLGRYPEQNVSVALLCNLASADPVSLGHQVADVFLPAAPSALAASGTRPAQMQDVTALAGLYRDPVSEDILRVEVKDNALVAEYFGRTAPLIAKAVNQFTAVGVSVDLAFDVDPAGKARGLTRISADGNSVRFVATKAVHPTLAELQGYVGTYYSDELETIYDVLLQGDSLAVRRRGTKAISLRPMDRDGFQSELFSVRFSRGKGSIVDGLALFAGRALNVRFRRQ